MRRGASKAIISTRSMNVAGYDGCGYQASWSLEPVTPSTISKIEDSLYETSHHTAGAISNINIIISLVIVINIDMQSIHWRPLFLRRNYQY